MLLQHATESLAQLDWNELRRLHTSLGLKATDGRTRNDYERRIIESQPKIETKAEPEIEPKAEPREPKVWTEVTHAVEINDYIQIPYQPTWIVADKDFTDDGQVRLVVKPVSASFTEEWLLPAPAAPKAPHTEIDCPSCQGIGELDDQPTCPTCSGEGSVTIADLERMLADLKAEVAVARKELVNWKPEPTIVWDTPYRGRSFGKHGPRPFAISGGQIHVCVNGYFLKENASGPTYHHRAIRRELEKRIATAIGA